MLTWLIYVTNLITFGHLQHYILQCTFYVLISLCKAAGFSLLTLNIAHTNVTQGLCLIICILHTYVPTMWDSQPPNHHTVTQATRHLLTLHNLGYKGPTEEGYSITRNCYLYSIDYNPKQVLGDNTSAHTHAGR